MNALLLAGGLGTRLRPLTERNDGMAAMIGADGGCCDGLGEAGVNRNQGAESTIAYWLTEAIYLRHRQKEAKPYALGVR
ncbi:hypothetical protein [Cohnella hongkongensis]|uniref:Nucleotidyl transferase domain-containing protein n=1 Tax=Cohnella hongkongensis TaxID=178337 RepID=A0ABV9FB67_9BACL